MVDGYNIGARNQHADSGAYEFHIHRAYIIYADRHEIIRIICSLLIALQAHKRRLIPWLQAPASLRITGFVEKIAVWPRETKLYNEFLLNDTHKIASLLKPL